MANAQHNAVGHLFLISDFRICININFKSEIEIGESVVGFQPNPPLAVHKNDRRQKYSKRRWGIVPIREPLSDAIGGKEEVMGMRMDQYIGLNDRGKELVAGEQVLLYTETIKREFPDGRVEVEGPQPVHGSNVRKEQYSEINGAFNDAVASLYLYTFPDGRVLREKRQATPWSSGPCYFVALKDEDGEWVPESLWTEQEMEEYL